METSINPLQIERNRDTLLIDRRNTGEKNLNSISTKQGAKFKKYQTNLAHTIIETDYMRENGKEGYRNINHANAYDLFDSETMFNPTKESTTLDSQAKYLDAQSKKLANKYKTKITDYKHQVQTVQDKLKKYPNNNRFAFVNQITLPTTSPINAGCYPDNTNPITLLNDIKAFIPTTNYVKNGTFDLSKITSGSYSTNASTDMPHWNFFPFLQYNISTWSACLISGTGTTTVAQNTFGIPTPFPFSSQAFVMSSSSSTAGSALYQYVRVKPPSTNYALIFNACTGSVQGTVSPNPLQIAIYDTKGSTLQSSWSLLYNQQVNISTQRQWSTVVIHFSTTTTTKSIALTIIPLGSGRTKSITAVTNIIICPKGDLDDSFYNVTDSPKIITPFIQGSSSFNTCKTLAYYNSKSNFSLKNVNTQTGQGFCTVLASPPDSNRQYTTANPYVVKNFLMQVNPYGYPADYAVITDTGSLGFMARAAANVAQTKYSPNDTLVWQTPSKPPILNNYVGCYNDNNPWALPHLLRGTFNRSTNADISNMVSYKQCQKQAESVGESLFSMQFPQLYNGEYVAACFTGNDLGTPGTRTRPGNRGATMYGPSKNCSIKDASGNFLGEPSVNAVYQTHVNPPPYTLSVRYNYGVDIMYPKADAPGGWATTWSLGSDKSVSNQSFYSNPTYSGVSVTDMKTGLPVRLTADTSQSMSSGHIMNQGDWINCGGGYLMLFMDYDGYLKLYNFMPGSTCTTDSSRNIVGMTGFESVYQIDPTTEIDQFGKFSYIDNSGNKLAVNNNLIDYTKSSTYTTLANTKPPTTLPNTHKTAVAGCQSICDSDAHCVGYVWTPGETNQCGTFTQSATTTPSQFAPIYPGSTTYLKTPAVTTSGNSGINGRASFVNNMTTSQYASIPAGTGEVNAGYMTADVRALNNTAAVTSDDIDTANAASGQLISSVTDLIHQNNDAQAQIKDNHHLIDSYSGKLNTTQTNIKNTIQGELHSYQSMEEDTELLKLQTNYQYLMWSILAVTVVGLTVNVLK